MTKRQISSSIDLENTTQAKIIHTNEDLFLRQFLGGIDDAFFKNFCDRFLGLTEVVMLRSSCKTLRDRMGQIYPPANQKLQKPKRHLMSIAFLEDKLDVVLWIRHTYRNYMDNENFILPDVTQNTSNLYHLAIQKIIIHDLESKHKHNLGYLAFCVKGVVCFLEDASKNNNLELCVWLIVWDKSKTTLPSSVYGNFAKFGNLEAIKTIHSMVGEKEQKTKRPFGTSGVEFYRNEYHPPNIAAHHGHLDIIKYFIDQGAFHDLSDIVKFAAIGGHLEILKELVEHKHEAIIPASRYGHIHILDWIKSKSPVLIALSRDNIVIAAMKGLKRNVIEWLDDNIICNEPMHLSEDKLFDLDSFKNDIGGVGVAFLEWCVTFVGKNIGRIFPLEYPRNHPYLEFAYRHTNIPVFEWFLKNGFRLGLFHVSEIASMYCKPENPNDKQLLLSLIKIRPNIKWDLENAQKLCEFEEITPFIIQQNRDEILDMYVYCANISILKKAKEQGFTIDYRNLIKAIEVDDLVLFQWLIVFCKPTSAYL